MIKDKVMRIMELALEICPPEITDVGMKRSAVFVEYAPHCNGLCVRIYERGWTSNNEPTFSVQVFLDNEDAEGKLESIINKVNEIKEGA